MTSRNLAQQAPADDALAKLNALMGAFEGIEPWKGEVPTGRSRTFIGALSPVEAWDRGKTPPKGTSYQETHLPCVTDGETFFEWISTLLAVRSAHRKFTMVSLGAHFGGPLVNAALALQKLNPMPFSLVGVEADPNTCVALAEHFRENGIDPNDHWIINCALSDSNRPVVFPVCGAAGGRCCGPAPPGSPDNVRPAASTRPAGRRPLPGRLPRPRRRWL